MAKQNLVIGQKYKVCAIPDTEQEYQFRSIEVNGASIPSKDIVMEDEIIGTYTFIMDSSIHSISATFIKGGGEQEVDIDDKPEGGSVEIQEENS